MLCQINLLRNFPYSAVLHFFHLHHQSKFWASYNFAKHQQRYHLFVYVMHEKFGQLHFWVSFTNTTVNKFFVIVIGQNFMQIDIFGQFCHASAAALQIFFILHIKILGSLKHQHFQFVFFLFFFFIFIFLFILRQYESITTQKIIIIKQLH